MTTAGNLTAGDALAAQPALTRPAPPWWTRDIMAFGITLLACSAFWVALDRGGFVNTEAHRALPGFAMGEPVSQTAGAHRSAAANLIIPRLYEQDYLRKPPGMPWAVAVSSAVFGETVLAARAVSAVSATLLALASAWFARRWFGRRATLAAGVAVALMPWMWTIGRQAEIEALQQLGVGIAALGTIDVLMSRRSVWLGAVAAALGTAVMLLAKGPAAAVVPAACVAGCVLGGGRPAIRRLATVAGAWLCGAAPFAAWVLAAERLAHTDAITQSPGAFMWVDPVGEIVTLPFAAFVAALPASLALLFPWGPDACGEASRPVHRRRLAIARTLAWGWLVSVVTLTALGVGNPRYTLPAAVLPAPAAGYVVWLLGGLLTSKRRSILRIMTLGAPAVLAGVLMLASAGYIGLHESRLREKSAEAAGIEIRALLDAAWEDLSSTRPGSGTQAEPGPSIIVLADGAIEARPEVLWPASQGPHDVRWVPGLSALLASSGGVPAVGDGLGDSLGEGSGEARVFVLLRDDAGGNELDALSSGVPRLGAFEAASFTFVLAGPLP